MMTRIAAPLTLLACLAAVTAGAAESDVPEPFRGFDPSSSYSINYDDISAMLGTSVVDVGRSTREKADQGQAHTGTRMKTRVRASTINEGNRFYFEAFMDHEGNKAILHNMRTSLEALPAEAPLRYFSRDEQLAYWLNLYNVTLLDEIVKVYPQRTLKKLLTGKKSILSQKILTVAGVPLSLDDIEFTILKENYGGNPLVLYGLYQGVIGGPNIRRRAYTGENVWNALADNAIEFVNSNRGTYPVDEKVFRVSSLYDRNREYFGDFDADIRQHLLKYLQGSERDSLQAASVIRADVDDWTVTDVYGTYREIGGTVADNPAALIDAITNTTVKGDQPVGVTTTMSVVGASTGGMSPALNRLSPEFVVYIKDINAKREAEAARNATVTVEDLDPATPDDGEKKDP